MTSKRLLKKRINCLKVLLKYGVPAYCWECPGLCYACRDFKPDQHIIKPEGECSQCFEEDPMEIHEDVECDIAEIIVRRNDRSKCTQVDIIKYLLEII